MAKINMKKIRVRLYIGLGAMYIMSIIVYSLSHGRDKLNFDYADKIQKQDIRVIAMLDSIENNLDYQEKELIVNFNNESAYKIRLIENIQELLLREDTSGIGQRVMQLEIIKSKIASYSDSVSVNKHINEIVETIWEKKKWINNEKQDHIKNIEERIITIRSGLLWVLNFGKYIVIIALVVMSIIFLLLPLVITNPIDNITERMLNIYKKLYNKNFTAKDKDETEIIEQIAEEFARDIEQLKRMNKDKN